MVNAATLLEIDLDELTNNTTLPATAGIVIDRLETELNKIFGTAAIKQIINDNVT